MKKRKPTAGERMIESARQALAFARGQEDHGCQVHVPDDIDVKAIREKISLSQSEFAKLFGLSKRTLEHWEHGRRVPQWSGAGFSHRDRARTGCGSACADPVGRPSTGPRSAPPPYTVPRKARASRTGSGVSAFGSSSSLPRHNIWIRRAASS